MSAPPPTVAAVIPAHDAREFVARALDSVLAQTSPVDEILLVDDGSRDGTVDFVASRYGPPVRVLRGPFGGPSAARNAGWRAARSTWVAFLDADDEWLPEKIERAFELLGRAPEAGWFFSDGMFEPEGAPASESWFAAYVDCPAEYIGRPLEALLEVNFIMTHTVMVRRALLEESGGFDEGLAQAEDLDLWIRLARRSPAAALARPLVRYHRRSSSLSSAAEQRLKSDEQVFGRLAADDSLAPPLRRKALERLGAVRFKLGFAALREGREREARHHLRGALAARTRRWPVVWAFAASYLPAAWVRRARGWESGKTWLAKPALRLRRATLRSERTLAGIAMPAPEALGGKG